MRFQRVRIRLLGAEDPVRRILEIPGVRKASPLDDGAVVATVAAGDDSAAQLLSAIVSVGLHPVEFAPLRIGLEDLFLDATKGDLA